MIHRYSSRRSPLKELLATQLQGAHHYDRTAGFFSYSLLEVAGEALERMTPESGETQKPFYPRRSKVRRQSWGSC